MVPLVSAPSTTKEALQFTCTYSFSYTLSWEALSGCNMTRSIESGLQQGISKNRKNHLWPLSTFPTFCYSFHQYYTPSIHIKKWIKDQNEKDQQRICIAINGISMVTVTSCHFSHCCVHCGERHRATVCPLVKKPSDMTV